MIGFIPVQYTYAMQLIDDFLITDFERKTMDFCIATSSKIWAGLVDEKLACITGVISPTILSDKAYLWLYTTPLVQGKEFIFVRHSQLVIEDLLTKYASIFGHAKIGADRSIRWLKWLGAEFGEPQGSMLPFRITKDGRSSNRINRGRKHRL